MREVVLLKTSPCASLRGCIAVAALLGACTPGLNWREARIAGTELAVMLPCKPTQHQRTVPLAGLMVTLHMTACDADGASFAIAHALIPDPSVAPQILARWRATTLENLAATQVSAAAESISSRSSAATTSKTLPGSLWANAQGKRSNQVAVQLQGVWFARGPRVYYVAVYAPIITPDMTDTYFSGLKLP